MIKLPAWAWILGCAAGAAASLYVATASGLSPLGSMGWSTAACAWLAAILGALR